MEAGSRGLEPGQGTTEALTAADALRLATALHQQGRLSDAEALYRRILEAVPEDPGAMHFLGVLRHQLGYDEEGLSLIRRALQVDPSYADAHCNLGNVLKQLGRFEEAQGCYRHVIRLEPRHAGAHNNLGVVLKVQGRLEEAEAAYRRAIALHPDHADAHHNLGNVLKRQGRLAESLGAYRRAIALNPRHADARKFLGLALRAAGRVEEAVAVFRDWASCEPENPVARHLFAACAGGDAPPRASDAYVATVFDRLADSFDEHLADLEYHAPALVAEAVRRAAPGPAGALDVLDAGCGTGLCGAFLRPYARSLSGVDLSPGMLARARRLSVYDELFQAELTGFLGEILARYDLIVSADTLCYFGDLEAVFAAAQRALRPGGLLVFTVERQAEAGPGFRLEPHGRYTHGETYVCRALSEAGLVVESAEGAVLRKEAGEPVEGLVFTARRATSPVGP
ncbi:MAG: tetratricopeptide repeat protein [Thermodesulfobacteriota bacterium]